MNNIAPHPWMEGTPIAATIYLVTKFLTYGDTIHEWHIPSSDGGPILVIGIIYHPHY